MKKNFLVFAAAALLTFLLFLSACSERESGLVSSASVHTSSSQSICESSSKISPVRKTGVRAYLGEERLLFIPEETVQIPADQEQTLQVQLTDALAYC